MSEFTVIDEMMPDVPPPNPGEVRRVRARVLRSKGTRRRAPLKWGGAVVAGVVTVALIVVTVVAVSGLVENSASGRQSAPVAGQPGEAWSWGSETATPARPGAEVLKEVVRRVASRRETVRRVWREEYESFSRGWLGDEQERYQVEEDSGGHTDWRGSVGVVTQGSRLPEVRPLTDGDKAAWERAGSPKLCGTTDTGEAGGCAPENNLKNETPHSGSRYAGRMFGETTVRFEKARGLPKDPARLKSYFMAHWAEQAAGSSPPWYSSDELLWWAGVHLLREVPATPGTRAAALRMLAALPNMRLTDEVKDAMGRVGLSFEWKRETAKHTLVYRMLINRATGHPLFVGVETTKGKPKEIGSIGFLVKRVGWTDELPKCATRKVSPCRI
ncbi:hypothetical protein [Rhizohabitans arisaemae]|uniref:hypothetical protein n=1 Tax=Rhizohabitans arisaemae TaxID=2720610 RepID=UPI0024B123A7|nr:hypothetical protein [Rhizohabitans arisaemae]